MVAVRSNENEMIDVFHSRNAPTTPLPELSLTKNIDVNISTLWQRENRERQSYILQIRLCQARLFESGKTYHSSSSVRR